MDTYLQTAKALNKVKSGDGPQPAKVRETAARAARRAERQQLRQELRGAGLVALLAEDGEEGGDDA